ncbi:EP300-interacting inhibitor of differentiation 3 [Trichoplax sp. H2]|nr:EP300-interacting inhibitor of differentiation 3 [Trichoplax sp. H2]|eukprot:RDD45525.1 EP300-interacting inhibitor of differentiation 3 [Trichoplax sp. H2]
MSESSVKQNDSIEDEQYRRLRQEYRSMIEHVEQNMEQYAQPGSSGIKETLEKAANLIRGVNRTREAVLDSQLLVAASKIARKQAQNVSNEGNIFDTDAFINALKTYLSSHNFNHSVSDSQEMPLDWAKLGRRCLRCFRSVPAVNTMYGPAKIQPRVKKQSNRSSRKEAVIPNAVVRPKEVDPNATEKESTTLEVHRIYNILYHLCHQGNKLQPINFFNFAIDPTSFGRTVENLFHISFLIRDGKVKITVENNVPKIVPLQTVDRSESENCNKKQTVISLDHNTWQELISSFKIDRCLITPRE